MDRFGPERKFALGLQKSFESSFTTREKFIKNERRWWGGQREGEEAHVCRKGGPEQLPLRGNKEGDCWHRCWNSSHTLTGFLRRLPSDISKWTHD